MSKNLIKTEKEFFEEGSAVECEYFDDGSILYTTYNINGSRLWSTNEDQSYYQSYFCGGCNTPLPECTCNPWDNDSF